MDAIPLRAKLGVVAGGYALVLATGIMLVYGRHLLYVNHPQEVMAASGMYAAGDWMLEIFIGVLLLVPTFFLALVIRKSERLYTGYSKVLLGLSLTAPLCLGIFSIPAVNQSSMLLGYVCMDRLFGSPIVILALLVSRLLARFDRARRLTSYALSIEILTLVLLAALLVLPAAARRG